jgi:hypothetical protein
MIINISRTVFSWYISMVKYFCPSQITGGNDKITNSPLLSDENIKSSIEIEETKKINKRYESCDLFEVDQLIGGKGMSEKDINKMIDNEDNEIYNEKYNKNYKQFVQNSQTNNSPIKKSYSTSLPVHYCGWCSKYIDSPSHFYMDRVYCNPNCRNYQIIKDDRMSIKKRHTVASFSN